MIRTRSMTALSRSRFSRRPCAGEHLREMVGGGPPYADARSMAPAGNKCECLSVAPWQKRWKEAGTYLYSLRNTEVGVMILRKMKP